MTGVLVIGSAVAAETALYVLLVRSAERAVRREP